jgi:FkbM family methyltransferase
MNQAITKLFRTLQVHFYYLQDAKFSVMRFYRNTFGIPFEKDFLALSLFPQVDGALYLDVGANRGQSTDAILMNTKGSRIQLFEPNLFLCEKLSRLYAHQEEVTIRNFGLGDQTTECLLYIPCYKKWMFDGLASFDKEKAKEWLNGRIFFYREKNLSLLESRSEIKRLDELGCEPFFIKMDIQGYELKALKGGERTIKRAEPILLIESPDHRIIDYLKGLGYRMYAFREGKFIEGVRGELNTFFLTEDKSSLVKKNIRAL